MTTYLDDEKILAEVDMIREEIKDFYNFTTDLTYNPNVSKITTVQPLYIDRLNNDTLEIMTILLLTEFLGHERASASLVASRDAVCCCCIRYFMILAQ